MKVLTQSELHNVSGGNRWRAAGRAAGRAGTVVGLFNAGYDAWTGFRDGWKSV